MSRRSYLRSSDKPISYYQFPNKKPRSTIIEIAQRIKKGNSFQKEKVEFILPTLIAFGEEDLAITIAQICFNRELTEEELNMLEEGKRWKKVQDYKDKIRGMKLNLITLGVPIKS